MSRLAILRLSWFVFTVALLVSAVVLALQFDRSWLAAILIGVVLLVPGRLQGILYRELFSARRLMAVRQHSDAIPLLTRFLESVERHPSLRWAMWLGWPGFSTSCVAMALNNRGACYFEIGELEKAEGDLRAAIEEDGRSPLPFVNLALLHAKRNEEAASEAALRRAMELGFRGGTADQIQSKMSGALAAVEGKKPNQLVQTTSGTRPET